MNIRLSMLSVNVVLLFSFLGGNSLVHAVTPTFKSALSEELNYAMALREWVV